MKSSKASKVLRISFALTLGILLWVGLAAFLLSFSSLSPRDGVDFIWQMVGFCFVLAALAYSANPKSLQESQRKKLPTMGILFIVSGVLLIVAYGLSMVAAKADPSFNKELLGLMGSGFGLVATITLAAGITIMTLGFLGED